MSVACSILKGDFPLNITWLFNGRVINDPTISINKVNKKLNTLSIDSVNAEYTGEYTCRAENLAGFATYSAYLYIHGTSSI